MGAVALRRATVASLTLVGCVAPVSAAAAPTLLDVWVNGRAIGKIGEFDLRGDALLASIEELAALGLAPRVTYVDGLAHIIRHSGFSWHVDPRAGSINFEKLRGATSGTCAREKLWISASLRTRLLVAPESSPIFCASRLRAGEHHTAAACVKPTGRFQGQANVELSANADWLRASPPQDVVAPQDVEERHS